MRTGEKNTGNEYYEILSDENDFITLISTKGGNFTPMHYHGSVELLVCTKGEFSVRTSNEIVTLHAGDAYFFDSYETHGYYGTADSETYILLYADSLFNAFRMHYGGVLPTRMQFVERDRDELIHAIDYAYSRWHEYNDFMKRGFANWIFGYAARQCGTVKAAVKKENQYVLAALRYIDAHYAAELSVRKVAAELGYSENYFSYLFNHCVGLRFGDYVNGVRLRKMDEVMKKDPLIGVGAAAQLCGFGSLNTYYRALKKMENKQFSQGHLIK